MHLALIFFILLFIGLPVAFVLMISAVSYVVLTDNYLLFYSFAQQIFSSLEKYGLLAIPLFLLVGELMGSGGSTRRLVDAASVLVGTLRGGLAYINLLANMMMASIMGSAIRFPAITIRSDVSMGWGEMAPVPPVMGLSLLAGPAKRSG